MPNLSEEVLEAVGRLEGEAAWLETLVSATTTNEKQRPKRRQMAKDLRTLTTHIRQSIGSARGCRELLLGALVEVQPRFWRQVEQRGYHECWPWRGSLKEAYGEVSTESVPNFPKLGLAHRLSWVIAHQENIPDGMIVCHKCDNTACVNPKHLFLGTAADNMADMVRKGRASRGPGRISRLDADAIALIAGNPSLSNRSLAKTLGVHHQTIANCRERILMDRRAQSPGEEPC